MTYTEKGLVVDAFNMLFAMHELRLGTVDEDEYVFWTKGSETETTCVSDDHSKKITWDYKEGHSIYTLLFVDFIKNKTLTEFGLFSKFSIEIDDSDDKGIGDIVMELLEKAELI